MFDDLFEKIRRVDEVEEKLTSLLESKTWEQVALALYHILDDISTADDICKENVSTFRNRVMKLQAKKNQLLYSPDGYVVKRVNEYVGSIYGLNDDELLIFYRRMDRGYRKASSSMLPSFVSDKKEVEAEIKKRGLEIPKMMGRPVESKLKEGTVDHAKRELQLAGLFDKDSDYNGMLGEAVLELMKVFATQGHSGFSAALTRDLFSRLSNFEPLTELTNNPNEWNDISEAQSGVPGWQSQRSPSCFSEDGGKTYWDINEEYYFYTDEDGQRWSGGLSKEEWKSRPMHTSKQVDKEE